jgi:hypothetical protein
MATECLITIDNALRLRQLLKGQSVPKLFICKHCKRPVKPLDEGYAKESGRKAPAHFEHLKRNLECPLSDKTTAKRLYAQHQVEKAKRRAATKN